MGVGVDWARSIIEQSDGKILIAGSDEQGSIGACTLIQLNEDGSFDETFGTDGISYVSAGSQIYYGEIVKIQPDNKIVVAGWILTEGELFWEWAASRFTSSIEVAIQEPVSSTSIQISPNPATNILYLDVMEINPDLHNYKVQISDMHNRILIEQNVYDLKSQFDIHSLSQGLYFINVISPEKIITKPFQKMD